MQGQFCSDELTSELASSIDELKLILKTSDWPSSLFCTALSSFSSSVLSPGFVPLHQQAACISLGGMQSEFLCGTFYFVHHRTPCDADPPGGPHCPHVGDNLPLALFREVCASRWNDCCSSEACKKIKQKLLSLRLRVLPTDIMCMSGSAFQWMALWWGFGAKPLKVQVLPLKSDL